MQNQDHRNFPTPGPQREVVEMFNIVKRRDFMLGRNVSIKEEAEKTARDYGREYVLVQITDAERSSADQRPLYGLTAIQRHDVAAE